MSIISKLWWGLIKINKSQHYRSFDWQIDSSYFDFVFFIATTKQAFSAIKHVKTVFHIKIEDDFLAYFMMIYIEWEIAEDIDSDLIIYEFYSIKYERMQLW
jgi:hypothetical protein